jgi:hypothetical protein
VLATIISSGLWLIPVLCLLFLASEGAWGRRRGAVPVPEPAGA